MLCKKGARSQSSSPEKRATNDEFGKISKTKCACFVEAHESNRQRLESSLPKHQDDHIEKRIQLDGTQEFGAQLHFNAASDENTGCESSSGQGMEKSRSNSTLEFGQNEKQKGGYSRNTKSQMESPLCYIDGHLSSQEFGVRTKKSEV